MAQASLVDEHDVWVLSVHDVCLHAVRYVCEACGPRPRGVVWVYVGRVGGQVNRAVPLGDLRGWGIRLLADEIVDVAMGCRVCATDRGQYVGVYWNERITRRGSYQFFGVLRSDVGALSQSRTFSHAVKYLIENMPFSTEPFAAPLLIM